MLNKNTLTLSVMSLCLLAGCTTSTAKLEADTAAQAVQLEQSQKALIELNKQVKGQSDILNAALAKAVPDHSAAQRLEAAKEAERRKMIETNISKVPEWFLQDETGPDAIYVTATEGSVDLQLSIDMAMMSAKRLLTNSLGEVISSRMTEFASQTTSGEDLILNKEIERVTKTMIAEVMLNGYLTKPVKPIELTNVLQTLCRRMAPAPVANLWLLRMSSLQLEPPGHSPIGLTVSEANLVYELALSGELLSMSRLIELFGDIDLPEATNKLRIEQIVSRVRRKLDVVLQGQPCIKAVTRMGYKLFIPVQIA